MIIRKLKIEEFKTYLEDQNFDTDHEFLVTESSISLKQNKAFEDEQILGSINPKSEIFDNSVQRIKNILMRDLIEDWCINRMNDSNLPLKFLPIIESIIQKHFVGDAEDFVEFSKIQKVKLVDAPEKTKIEIADITKDYSKYFDDSFIEEFIRLELPTKPSTGKFETFLCLMTDYSKPPHGSLGDLWSDKGSIEVKINGGRLGGTDVRIDGLQSKTLFEEALGVGGDQKNGWRLGTYKYLMPFLEELKKEDQHLYNPEALMQILSNYPIEFTKQDIDFFVEKMDIDLTNLHTAIQLKAYMNAHKIKEIIFISKDLKYFVKYAGDGTLSDSYDFCSAFIKNLSGWGNNNPDRPGLSTRLI